MDGGAHRGGLRRRGRGAGGAPRQGPRAGVAAGGGGRGGRRDGRGGGRVGGRDGNGGRVAEARGAAQCVRAPRAPNPRLTDWFAKAKYINPDGLSLEAFEDTLDQFLENKSRVNQQELAVYTIQDQLLEQGPHAARLIIESDDGYRKMAVSRKILLRMYVNGMKDTPQAQYWRKCLHEQKMQLEYTLDELQKAKKDFRPMPTLFADMPDLLPKEKK